MAQQKLYTGIPFERINTKSPTISLGKLTSPRIRSPEMYIEFSFCLGTLNRMTASCPRQFFACACLETPIK